MGTTHKPDQRPEQVNQNGTWRTMLTIAQGPVLSYKQAHWMREREIFLCTVY